MRALRIATFALAWLAAAGTASADADDPGGRVQRVELWLKAVLHHRPGEADEAGRAFVRWSNDDLAVLNVDEFVIAQLLRNSGVRTLRLPTATFISPAPTSRLIPARSPVLPYTDAQLHRLRVLACAASGALDRSDCARTNAGGEVDAALKELSRVANASRLRGDDNYVLRHGALLHTDAA